MVEDMRIIQQNRMNTIQILVSQNRVLFYSNIIRKYVLKIKLSHNQVLDYLLQQNIPSTNLNLQTLHKQFEKHLSNQYKDLILNRYQIVQKNILNTQNQMLSGNKEESKFFLMQNNVLKKELIDRSFSNKDLMFNKYQIVQKNILNRQESKNKSFNNKNLIFHNNSIVKNILIKEETKDISFHHKSATANRWSTEENSVHLVHKHKVLAQEISDKTGQSDLVENIMAQRSVTVEKRIEEINHYEIKQLVKKVYPLVMKQWQKEFERRGVFYG